LPPKKTNSRKRDALRQQGCLNLRPERVTDPLFQQSDFFDADDLVQVKYEMLRRVRIDQKPVSQAAAAFGFSRPTYYQAELDFQQQGLFGLLPEKRGPRRAHKLTPQVLEYVRQIRSEQPSLGMAQVGDAILERFGVTVHPRSIERALAREEKKRRIPG
jgi:transposase